MKTYFKKYFPKIAIIACFVLLLLFPQIVTTGAANGLTLWFYNVIPALFPAMLLTQLTMLIFEKNMKNPLPFVLITGLICGYPIGAVSVGLLNKSNPGHASFYNTLMPYINVTSPAFILNYVLMMGLSGNNKSLLIVCVYVPILVCIAVVLAVGRKKKIVCPPSYAPDRAGEAHPAPNLFEAFETAVTSTLENIAKLGAYIIICAILCQFIMNFPLSVNIKCILCGMMEITTGIYFLSLTTFTPAVRLILVCTFCAFGGLSCLGQTYIVSGPHFQAKKYICHKLILAAVTAVTASLVAYVFLL